MCPTAAHVGADCTGDRLEVGLDVGCRDVVPLATGCSLGRTSSGTAAYSLVQVVGEAALAGFTTELTVPSADLTSAFAALEKLTVWHAGFKWREGGCG